MLILDKFHQADELGEALLQLIEENLDINKWKFSPTHKDFRNKGKLKIIYDSKWCRINFRFSRQRLRSLDELSVYYGRLHAPNDEDFMNWKGEKCWCWHDVKTVLRFLDGLSPIEAKQQEKELGPLPTVVDNFWHSNQGKKLREEYSPKYTIVLQSAIWNYYGQRFFELFDLRQPRLWNQYRQFSKEFYNLFDRKAIYGPPYENVC
jgi:hypothetical protein